MALNDRDFGPRGKISENSMPAWSHLKIAQFAPASSSFLGLNRTQAYADRASAQTRKDHSAIVRARRWIHHARAEPDSLCPEGSSRGRVDSGFSRSERKASDATERPSTPDFIVRVDETQHRCHGAGRHRAAGHYAVDCLYRAKTRPDFIPVDLPSRAQESTRGHCIRENESRL